MVSGLAAVLAATPAAASEDYFEVWFSPTVDVGVGNRTTVRLETAQRFRSSADGGRDTLYFRLWANRKIGKGLTLSGGIEQRWNDAQQEQRVLQQLSWSRGILRSRSRIEQRFVAGDPLMGLRFRQRLGVEVPLDENWSAEANAEGFFVLQGTARGGQTGLTGLRTFVGVGRDLSKNLAVSFGYLRNQDIRQGRADRVGHAPLLGLDVTF
jgi:hypothetical protein